MRRGRAALRGGTAWLFRLRGSPEAIARGLAVGTFVAFTPTIGVQLVIALALATVLNGNRPAAAVGVAITNPVTIPPAFAFTYWVGSFVRDGPPAERVHGLMNDAVRTLGRHEFWEMEEPVRAFLALTRDVFVPLWIGGILVGAAAALGVYAASLPVLRRARRRRELRARRRARPGAAAGLRDPEAP